MIDEDSLLGMINDMYAGMITAYQDTSEKLLILCKSALDNPETSQEVRDFIHEVGKIMVAKGPNV